MGDFLFVLAIIFGVMSVTSILFKQYITMIKWIGLIIEAIATVAGIIYLNTNNRVKK